MRRTGASGPGQRRTAARQSRSSSRHYRRAWRLPVGSSSRRIRSFMAILLVVVVLIAGRAFQLQAIEAEAFAAEASDKMEATKELRPTRGSIYDRNGVVLAATEPAVIVSIDPDMIVSNGADKRHRMSERKLEESEAAPAAVAEILATH
ncbi:MAG: penicillin-binding protein 2, partial [Arachnia sp.]